MNEFCPSGHELNEAGVCDRDGYVKPAETLADIVEDVAEEVPAEEGKVEEESSAQSDDSSEVSLENVEMVDHVITQEDLDNNPDLVTEGVQVGETIQLPVVPREDVVAALGEEAVAQIEADAVPTVTEEAATI